MAGQLAGLEARNLARGEAVAAFKEDDERTHKNGACSLPFALLSVAQVLSSSTHTARCHFHVVRQQLQFVPPPTLLTSQIIVLLFVCAYPRVVLGDSTVNGLVVGGRSGCAPPPTLRKFAGLPLCMSTMSMVAMAIPPTNPWTSFCCIWGIASSPAAPSTQVPCTSPWASPLPKRQRSCAADLDLVGRVPQKWTDRRDERPCAQTPCASFNRER